MSNLDIDETMPIHPKNENDMGETQPVKPSVPSEIENSQVSEQTIAIQSLADDPSGETVAIKSNQKEKGEGESSMEEISTPEEGPVDTTPPNIPPEEKPVKAQRKPKRWLWILLGILLVMIVGSAGGFWGYQIAIQMRIQNQAAQVALTTAAQYQLAMADISNAKFDVARQRLEYVIQLDPNFPGAAEGLTQVMLIMAETAVPTVAPTATTIPLTPTPDTRTEQQLFDEANAQLRAHDWNGAIGTVEVLRKTNLIYRAVEVDGMYYTGLRHRGIEKILGGNLEGGMYDLALAERIGPLDHDAESYRTWARYYLVGASFWKVDWGKVVEVFGEIYASLPNLSDGTGWTAQERYRVACINYADQLAKQEMWCDARYYYDQAFALGADAAAGPTATAVKLICEPPTATPTMTLAITITPTPTSTVESVVTTEEVVPTEDPLVAICCRSDDPAYNHDDPSCASFTCP